MQGFHSGPAGANGHPSSGRTAAEGAPEPEALSVTHWFDSGTNGEPYAATVRFTGRRVGIDGKPTAGDVFTQDETIEDIAPGSGPVSITALVYGLQPGEWTVTADLIRRPRSAGDHIPAGGGKLAGSRTLPRAAWSWHRWALSSGAFAPVKTRWAPLVRMTRVPAVVHGSWSGLIAFGVLVGVMVQTTLLVRDNVSVGEALLVDTLALVSGLIAAKLWYIALRPRSWRQRIAEGWTVDGLLLGAPAVGVAAMLALNLPIGAFLDASTPGLFFGVAIGRLGCFLTGCCAGRCTASRWGVWSSDRRVGARRIPTQLLESAAGLLIGVGSLLLVLGSMRAINGAVFVAAIAIYVVIRQVFLRLRAERRRVSMLAPLTTAAAGLVLLANAML